MPADASIYARDDERRMHNNLRHRLSLPEKEFAGKVNAEQKRQRSKECI